MIKETPKIARWLIGGKGERGDEASEKKCKKVGGEKIKAG